MRVAALISHPVQYYAPIFRELARRTDLHVFFGQKIEPAQQAATGFGVAFDWDVDLLSGYRSSYLRNVAHAPSPDTYFGCDTPDICQHLREGRFDALMVAGWYQKTHAQAIWAAKRLGVPIIIRGDSHLSTPRRSAIRVMKEMAFPRLLRVFDAALYVGQLSRAYYHHYGFPPERLFFSPHCVDNEWFMQRATEEARASVRAAHGIGQSSQIVLLAAKLIPLKRPFDLVEAVARLRKRGQDIALMVAGSGPLLEEVANRARELSLPLIALGFCNQSRMPEVYAAADILAIPSAHETWGLVANEALACGRPVVASDACGCVCDLEEAGGAVRSYPMGNIEVLSDRIASFLDQPPDSNEISRVCNRFSVRAAVDGIEQAVTWCYRSRTVIA